MRERIGKFEIVAQLGQGAMGTVYRARDPELDREVALKTVSATLVSRPEALERFKREARAAARLQHPGIVTIYELGEVGGIPYIAMELLAGHDLSQTVEQRQRLSLGHKLKMVVEICRALDFAHKKGVVHRDVKPANIRVLPDGSIKLVDFGIARLADSKMTQTGLVLGTPSYVAPEALVETHVDHRGDMWAVGVVMYELLTGRCPFEAQSIPALVYKIAREEPRPLDAAAHGLPGTVVEVVKRALQKAPGDRFQDLAEMALALELAGGLSGPIDSVLAPEERASSCQHSVSEAQRLLGRNDLEGALEAARRAQALEPSRTDVLTLVRSIEERLEDAPTVDVATPGTPPSVPTSELAPVPTPAPQATAPVPAASPVGTLDQLRRLGASAFRDLGAFGEPTPTLAACLYRPWDHLATCGADGAIRIWDLRARALWHTLRTGMHRRAGHDARALVAAYSPDGSLLASGHVDGAVHLWDVAKGVEIPVRLRHDAMVGAAAFSADGRVLASGGMDKTLKLWDVEAAINHEARRELIRQPAGITTLAFDLRGRWLATGHSNRHLRLLDGKTHRLVATLRGLEGQPNQLASSPDGARLAAVSHDRAVHVFDTDARLEAFALQSRRPAAAISFLDDTVAATVGLDNAVHLWDMQSGTETAVLWGPSGESFACVAALEDGQRLAAVLADGRIRLWGAG